MIVYLARAIQAFVMYCVNGTSRSSLLIESTDSMIIRIIIILFVKINSVIIIVTIMFMYPITTLHTSHLAIEFMTF